MATILDDDLVSKNDAFVQYRYFLNQEEMLAFGEFLTQNHIPNRSGLLPTMGNSVLTGEVSMLKYFVEVRREHFEQVDQLLAKEATAFVDSPEMSEHPLSSFTAKELYEVVMKPDEWSPEYVQIAKILLARQGVMPEEAPTPKRSAPSISTKQWGWVFVIVLMLWFVLKKLMSGEIRL